jgi:integral membrane sensor domain MASE1
MGPKASLHLSVFGSWMIGFGAAALLEYAPNASLWFPPAGITFAAVLVLGLRALPVLWLGCLVVTVLSDQIYQRGMAWPELLLAGLAFAATHTLMYAAMALVLRALHRHPSPASEWNSVIKFLLGGALAAGLSSLLGGLSLAFSGMVEFAVLPSLIVTWWIGDYAGLITVGPLFAVLLTRVAAALDLVAANRLGEVLGPDPWRSLWPNETGKLAILTLPTAIMIAIVANFAEHPGLVYILLACVPIQIWIATTESPLATLLGVFGITLLLAAAAGMTNLSNHAPVLQILVITLAAASYLSLAAARRVRQKTLTA